VWTPVTRPISWRRRHAKPRRPPAPARPSPPATTSRDGSAVLHTSANHLRGGARLHPSCFAPTDRSQEISIDLSGTTRVGSAETRGLFIWRQAQGVPLSPAAR